MTGNKKIRFVIAGGGHIGKRHARVVINNPEAELLAICDPDISLHEELKTLSPAVYKSLDEMLAGESEADVLSIATPNGLHAAQALIGLDKGLHVLIEKPMALHAEDCRKVIEKAEGVSRNVFCVMQNRYSPPSRWIKEIIEADVLGKIYSVQISCFWNRDNRYYNGKTWRGSKALDGGTLFTQFSHFIDMLYWLFGDIANIQSKFSNNNHAGLTEFEDSGEILFDFVKGGSGSFHYSTSVWDANMGSTLNIIAENGSVRIGGQYMNKLEYCHIKNYEAPELVESEPPNDYGSYKGSAANHHFVYENVIDVLKGRANAGNGAQEGLMVADIIERIYRNNPYLKH